MPCVRAGHVWCRSGQRLGNNWQRNTSASPRCSELCGLAKRAMLGELPGKRPKIDRGGWWGTPERSGPVVDRHPFPLSRRPLEMSFTTSKGPGEWLNSVVLIQWPCRFSGLNFEDREEIQSLGAGMSGSGRFFLYLWICGRIVTACLADGYIIYRLLLWSFRGITMKNHLWAVAVLIVALGGGVTGGALAADLPLKAPPAAYWSWAGFYVGTQSSAYAGRTKFDDPFGPSIFGDRAVTPGYAWGGLIGYNWQSGNFVYGLEADANLLSSDGAVTCAAFSGFYSSSNCR